MHQLEGTEISKRRKSYSNFLSVSSIISGQVEKFYWLLLFVQHLGSDCLSIYLISQFASMIKRQMLLTTQHPISHHRTTKILAMGFLLLLLLLLLPVVCLSGWLAVYYSFVVAINRQFILSASRFFYKTKTSTIKIALTAN